MHFSIKPYTHCNNQTLLKYKPESLNTNIKYLIFVYRITLEHHKAFLLIHNKDQQTPLLCIKNGLKRCSQIFLLCKYKSYLDLICRIQSNSKYLLPRGIFKLIFKNVVLLYLTKKLQD